MEKQQQTLAVAIVMLLIGAFLGWAVTSRQYGVGPLADLQGVHSDASGGLRAGGPCGDPNQSAGCCKTWGGTWTPAGGCEPQGATRANSSTSTSPTSDLLAATFWVTAPDTCEAHNAVPTGRIWDNLDTGVRKIECRANRGHSTGD